MCVPNPCLTAHPTLPVGLGFLPSDTAPCCIGARLLPLLTGAGGAGGKKEIMEVVAPAGPMYQAGTLSGNPLAMTAGIKTLEILQRPGSYEHLDKITKKLINGILDAGREAGHEVCGGSISGMFGFFFCKGPVTNCKEAMKADTAKFAKWHRGMLEEGVYLAPSQFEAGFTGLKHTDADIDDTIKAAKRVFARI